MVMMRPRGGPVLHARRMPIPTVPYATAPATNAAPARALPGKRKPPVSCAH